MSKLTSIQKEKIDALVLAYGDALDRKNMADWLACFVEEDRASYSCIAQENVENNLPIAHMLDNNHAKLVDRKKYVDEVWAGTFEDYQTRHFSQRVSAEILEDGTARVRSNFFVAWTDEQVRDSKILVVGVYEDTVDLSGDSAKLITRRAIMDTNVPQRYLVYPV